MCNYVAYNRLPRCLVDYKPPA